MGLRKQTLLHRWVKACTRKKWLGYPTGGWSETPPTVESIPMFDREKVQKTSHSSLEESKDSVERFRHSRSPRVFYSHGVG
ncbi:hypothetical protein CsSME_00031972 [Camellia sinensis var. sinensis]